MENLDLGEVRNCRARLIGVTHAGGPQAAHLDIPLAWAQPDHASDPSRKTFHSGALLEVVVHGDPRSPNYMVPASVGTRNAFGVNVVQIDRDVENILGVEVSPEGVAPTVAWFRFKWWNHVVIPGKDGEPDTYYLLRSDSVEFEPVDR